MNAEPVGYVYPNRIPPYAKPLPTFPLPIYGCDLVALQRIRDASTSPIVPIRMQAGDREFLGHIEEISGGDVCTVRISMHPLRSRA